MCQRARPSARGSLRSATVSVQKTKASVALSLAIQRRGQSQNLPDFPVGLFWSCVCLNMCSGPSTRQRFGQREVRNWGAVNVSAWVSVQTLRTACWRWPPT